MDTREVRDLYEAYLQVHQPQEEVEQLDEEAPERITKPTKNKRLMKDAGPARLHNPKNVDEEVVDEAMSSYDRNRRRAAQRAAERNAARDRGQTGNVPGVGYVSPRRERETYTGESGQEYHKSGARMPKKEDQKESFDLFDTILEYLVAEGYADTNEAALAIMANMSEEWRESIVEEVFDEALTGERYKKVMNKPGGTAYSRKVSADPSKRATRGGRGGESDFGAGDRGSGNKAARRAGTYKED